MTDTTTQSIMKCKECGNKIPTVNEMPGADFARLIIENTCYVVCEKCNSYVLLSYEDVIDRFGKIIDKLEEL